MQGRFRAQEASVGAHCISRGKALCAEEEEGRRQWPPLHDSSTHGVLESRSGLPSGLSSGIPPPFFPRVVLGPTWQGPLQPLERTMAPCLGDGGSETAILKVALGENGVQCGGCGSAGTEGAKFLGLVTGWSRPDLGDTHAGWQTELALHLWPRWRPAPIQLGSSWSIPPAEPVGRYLGNSLLQPPLSPTAQPPTHAESEF